MRSLLLRPPPLLLSLAAAAAAATPSSPSDRILPSAFGVVAPPRTLGRTTGAFLSVVRSRSDAPPSSWALHAKKILLAFDGTGNNARDFLPELVPNEDVDRSFTNVLKLHLLAGGAISDPNRTDIDGQISLYERGIGANTDIKLLSIIRQIGGDLSRQTKPMRRRLEAVYERGDKIYMIGFSRGSASARKFAADLHKDGLRTKDGELVPDPPVEFLGCFDTVSVQIKRRGYKILWNRLSKQMPKSTVLGEKGRIPPNVKLAVHNVAMDDNRMFDTLMRYPPILMGTGEEDSGGEGGRPRVNEVWFAGEHGDVGGGYYTKGAPDISCQYMMEWIESLGGDDNGDGDTLKFIKAVDINPECLKIDSLQDVVIDPSLLTLSPNATDKLHLVDSQILDELSIDNPRLRPVVRVENDSVIPGASVRVHVSVLERMKALKEKGDKRYNINPMIKKAKVEIVGSLGRVLEDETREFVELLKSDYKDYV